MVFEGLVINKVPFKERDLIVKLILRNGQLGSFYIYGGQGGGKHHKPTIYELGSLIRVMIRENKKGHVEGAELMVAQESHRLWEPNFIRHDVQAYYLSCLYYEILQKFTVSFRPGPESEKVDIQGEGIFSVISNALFHLNDALEKKNFIPHQHLTLFLIKILFHLGIMPNTELCSYCSAELLKAESVSFIPAEGQFACGICLQGENERGFLVRVRKGYQTNFKDYQELLGTNFPEADRLLQYVCHQFQQRPVELKAYSLLFR